MSTAAANPTLPLSIFVTPANDSLTREEISHLQQLVRDLVQGDTNLPGGVDSADGFDQIPYIIKRIFQTGREDAFGEQLNYYCSRKEAEIERMCNLHYQV